MWVAMIGEIYGTNYGTTKVDITTDTKKYANLDAKGDVKVVANMGETSETKQDEKNG